jgi:hypothetical protein
MNELINLFIEQEKTKGEAAGVIFDLAKAQRVSYGNIQCNGFFESHYQHEGKIVPYLATATGKPLDSWLPIFTHESSHMDQWLENSSFWLTSEDFLVLDNWLEGKDYPLEEITSFIHKVILVEADCELRTMEKIKKYSLPIDLAVYAQRANSYLHYYQWLLKSRAWYKTAPYEIKEIVSLMPTSVREPSFYLSPISEQLHQQFEKCRS